MIDPKYFWTVIILLALGTFAIRGTLIFLSSRIKITERVRQIFSFIPAAILPSMIAPMVFFHQGQVQWLAGKERFAVLLLSTTVCFFTRSMLMTICFGLGALYLLTAVI